MSHDATNWAIRQRGLKPAAKLVLWHLCDRYHPDNGCFPSQDRLAEDCELSRSSLNDQLEALEEAKLIARQRRNAEGSNRRQSTRYTFAFEKDFVPKEVEKPCPDFGHGNDEAMSEKTEKPCPKNAESHVRNSDTNSVREPVREPVTERERGRESDFGKNKIGVVDAELIKRVQDFCTGKGYSAGEWKGWGGATIGHIAKHFAALSLEDRDKACQYRDAFLAKCNRDNGGSTMRVANYFRDRVWEMLTPADVAAEGRNVAATHVANVFSRAWMAKRLAVVLQPASQRMPAPTAYQRAVIAAGGIEAENLKRERLKLYGWPALDLIDKRSCSVDAPLVALSESFERVEPDSDLWRAWQALHDRNGWRWLPPAGDHKHFFFPAIDAGSDDLNIAVADALARFAARLAEANDDAA